MKTLLTVAAVAGLALAQAQAWSYSAMPNNDRLIEAFPHDAQHLAPEHVLPVKFAETIAISGASVVLQLDQALILIDPVGDQLQYRRFGRPDIVVLTSSDADHLSIDTMIGLLRRDTLVLAPQSVIDQLPLMIANNVIAPFEVGTGQTERGITFRALSHSADLPRGTQVYERDRGDIGVLIEIDGQRAYF